ncbi:hypothetical protein ACJIZ3_012221 [Penstemon smallii]|uniref:Nucleoplasmin-like domain-containing protein n=1 Tax=Penstemon smallii TaxID=265156 RepID=A0ABD3ULD8_9LAMI
MEFWGVEVKPGEALKVRPQFAKLIHISQAALGEVKNVEGAKNIPLRLKADGKSFIVGSLAAEDRTQLMFDLVFEKEFELSHDWKNGSVYFMGYIADDPVSDGEIDSEFEDDSEDELVGAHENGDVELKAEDVKAAKSAVAAPKAVTKKVEQPESDEDEDSDDDDDSVDSDSDSDGDMALDEEDSSDGDDSEEDIPIEKELPKVQHSKKRSAEPAQETQVPAKKAKSDNKGPFPSKAAGKQAPKSHNQFPSNNRNKSFVQSKAKRGGK